MSDTLEHREPAIRLSRDLIKASSTMTTMEARYLVDALHIVQMCRGDFFLECQRGFSFAHFNAPHCVSAAIASSSVRASA